MNDIHIGHEIDKRMKQMRMSKIEFARRMDMPQQNVNRILDSPHIMTNKLLQICDVLDFNFFSLYHQGKGDINLVASGEHSIAALASDVHTTDSNLLYERVRYLEQILLDKEQIIRDKERLIQFLTREKDGEMSAQEDG